MGLTRRFTAAAAAAIVVGASGTVLVLDGGGGRARGTRPRATRAQDPGLRAASAVATTAGTRAATTARPRRPFAVGLRRLRLVDRSRMVRQADGRIVARALLTDVRYPATGAASGTDARDAPGAVAGGPYPLVIFGHGFALLPSTYTLLLRAWARAGYVVAAPAFPLERADAPGGADQSDLVNQPGDVRFVISRLLRASAAPRGPLHGMIDPLQVAVGGHSDGGATAQAVAYDAREHDARVRAAMVLSGAGLTGGASITRGSPPLLLVQGTADPVHPPQSTYAVFAAARRPKYLMRLLGAGHEDPYTTQPAWRRAVERVGIAFLDAYLLRRRGAARRLSAAGHVPGIASLTAAP